jgi:hypothetical protein
MKKFIWMILPATLAGAATGVPPDEWVLPGADDDKDPVFERGLQVLKKALVR